MEPRHTSPMNASGAAGAMPTIVRGSMTPRPWAGFWRGLASRRHFRVASGHEARRPGRPPRAGAAPAAVLVIVATAFATFVLAHAQPELDHPVLQGIQIGLFALLFAWVAAGCFTAMMGFVVLLRGDRHALSALSAGNAPLPADARTAIIMPICNEDVATVFAGLRATIESLARENVLHAFDVFVLSDSNDPDTIAAERAAWADLRATMGGHGRLFYRVRKVRRKRKAGNVADFCRRWGRDYRYMVVMDADSVMSGDCLQTLVRLMEKHPGAGILQTAPQAVGHSTLHARAQQFASRVTGGLFTAGMQYWQLGEAHYWGHNAIIRVEPFMEHCAHAKLPGTGALAGDILSHDFVEAALMRRAGYYVWLVHDLQGSYEQQPPHLLAELQRDRRWCQGNLQNARLIAEPGLHGVHRAMLATGAMAYVSAPLWLAYVVLGAVLWLVGDNARFTAGRAACRRHPRPVGRHARDAGAAAPAGRAGRAAAPRDRPTRRHRRLVQARCSKQGLSVLQAPVRMVAHTLFVVVALTGLKLNWKSPPREACDVQWSQVRRRRLPLQSSGNLLTLGARAWRWQRPARPPCCGCCRWASPSCWPCRSPSSPESSSSRRARTARHAC